MDKRSNPNDPLGPLYHILRVFLIDRDGNILLAHRSKDPADRSTTAELLQEIDRAQRFT